MPVCAGVLSLDDYLNEEQRRTRTSRKLLEQDICLLHKLEDAYKKWLTRKETYHAAEIIYFSFCCLAHASFLHSVGSFLRHHTAEALSSTRTAVDATFNAVMVDSGLLTEEEYLTGSTKVETLPRQIRNADKAKKPVPEGASRLLNMRSSLSSIGAHADVRAALSERWHGRGATVHFDYFQRPADDERFRSYFIQIIWTHQYCLAEFISIARDRGDHVSDIIDTLADWDRRALARLKTLQDQIGLEILQ